MAGEVEAIEQGNLQNENRSLEAAGAAPDATSRMANWLLRRRCSEEQVLTKTLDSLLQ